MLGGEIEAAAAPGRVRVAARDLGPDLLGLLERKEVELDRVPRRNRGAEDVRLERPRAGELPLRDTSEGFEPHGEEADEPIVAVVEVHVLLRR
jgi:hypothetical protein